MKNADTREAQKAKWSVVVLFENADARDKAVAFCDRLVEQFLQGLGIRGVAEVGAFPLHAHEAFDLELLEVV